MDARARRRVVAMEREYRQAAAPDRCEAAGAHARWLAPGNAIRNTLERVARERASRRALHEGGASFWPYVTTAEASALIAAEVEAGIRLEAEHPDWEFFALVEAWCAEPDDRGWPRSNHGDTSASLPLTEQFWVWLWLERKRSDAIRATNPAWCAAHPEWSRSMTEGEFLRWELDGLEALADGR